MEVSQTILQSTHKRSTPAILDLLLLDEAFEPVRLMEPGVGRNPCVSLTCEIPWSALYGNVLARKYSCLSLADVLIHVQ